MKWYQKFHNELTGIAFLLPNIIGFCVFIMVPLVASFILAFSNWNVQLHNMFKDHPLQWVGLENFRTLFEQPRFWQYLGNTLFLMIGIPFSIAGSLMAALLLNRDPRPVNRRVRGFFLAGAVLLGACLILVAAGFGLSAVWMLLAVMVSGILVMGVLSGTVVHRTLFYTPHFTAGVATFILWKKLYNPHSGPINAVLHPLLEWFAVLVNAFPAWMGDAGYVFLGALVLLLVCWRIRVIFANLRDRDAGVVTTVVSGGLILLPVVLSVFWLDSHRLGLTMLLTSFAVIGKGLFRKGNGMAGRRVAPAYRLGENLMFSLGLMVLAFILIGFARVTLHLPAMAADGLHPPDWLIDFHWAKPSIMIMALWAAIGSNNMILYLAGLKNIPVELYEAAEIDGASPIQRFWHVTWPQLAPFTFFIFVMSIIHGLQGGFEMARAMTHGAGGGHDNPELLHLYRRI
ncbi:MAG: sugar ABC transporter permease [Opitutaceae bacterium]